MAKKADLQLSQELYDNHMAKAAEAENAGQFKEAMDHAEEAWAYVDEMMRFEKRFEKKSFRSVPCIDMVLKYAPLMLDFKRLDRLESLLKSKRSIDRDASDDLDERLNLAKLEMTQGYRLIDLVERNPGIKQMEIDDLLGGTASYWRSLIDRIAKIGILHRDKDNTSIRLRVSYALDQAVKAKCCACGELEEILLGVAIEHATCTKCKVHSEFVVTELLNTLSSERSQ